MHLLNGTPLPRFAMFERWALVVAQQRLPFETWLRPAPRHKLGREKTRRNFGIVVNVDV